MQIFLDVDGTIARNNRALYVALCNRKLKLGIDEERLAGLPYEEFFTLPEVTAYRERVGEKRYQWSLHLLTLDPELQRQMEIIDGAVEGARLLVQSGDLRYCTSRKTTWHEDLNAAMARATHYWLKVNGFPNHQQVVFCTSPREKLSFCAARIEETGEEIVLVDDLYECLLSEVGELEARRRELLQLQLTLWAFGARECHLPEHTPFRVVAFPAWDQIECVTQHTEGKEARVH